MLPGLADANLTGSTFESNDGDLLVTTTGDLDWENAPDLSVGTEQFSGKNDNSFGQGAKEDDPSTTVVTGSIPPNKSDLTRFYVANDKQAGSSFLYLAWDGQRQHGLRDQQARPAGPHDHRSQDAEPVGG
jgi:hypothetical protein